MNLLTQRLLNDYQRGFPLCPHPFDRLANDLQNTPDDVIDQFRTLQDRGVVSRIGPVFRPNTVGASTLAAMAVPPEKLVEVAEQVNAFPQVNHNYEREHSFNLWFVVTAASEAEVKATLDDIRQATGIEVMPLPLLRDYHIDLGFRMTLNDSEDVTELPGRNSPVQSNLSASSYDIDSDDLIAAIQHGLPLVARPYQVIAERMGCSEEALIQRLQSLIDARIIKRLGVVVRHHELGYRANAMVVWDVPDHQVDAIGQRLGDQDCVTLCYQRPRHRPQWPYNLFCMVHGKDRDAVLACIRQFALELGIHHLPREVLFSGRRFRQRGAW